MIIIFGPGWGNRKLENPQFPFKKTYAHGEIILKINVVNSVKELI